MVYKSDDLAGHFYLFLSKLWVCIAQLVCGLLSLLGVGCVEIGFLAKF